MAGIGTVQFGVRLVMASGMGALVGLERQWRQRMAGTRTNALVAGGAAAFIMCGLLLNNDPSARGRIISYVVSEVGFLVRESSSRPYVIAGWSLLIAYIGTAAAVTGGLTNY